MADKHHPADDRQRFLIATGVTRDLPRSRDRLIASVERMTKLFTETFGYQRVTNLGLDPTAEQLRAQLRDFCEKCDPEDIVAYYHTGHAEIGPRGHRIRTGGEGNVYVTSVPTAELAELMLEETKLRNVLIILDTCFAGQGGAESLMSGLRASGAAEGKTLTVVTAAHPAEQVRAGDFADLFEKAVHHPATAGHEPTYLSISAVVGHIREDPHRPGWQTVSESVLFNEVEIQPFLPNPRFDPWLQGLDLFTQLRIQQQQLRTEEIRSHFLPRARGTDSPDETQWRFVGRYASLRDLTAWLRNDDGERSRVQVVTGDPGSGKSAVIGRLVVLADRQRHASVPLEGIPVETMPDLGAFDVAIHARGLTTEQVLEGLAATAGINVDTTGQFLNAMRGRRLVAGVDAIDESVDPQDLVDRLLMPLADAAGHKDLRLMLGTRRHLAEQFASTADVLDLDAEDYADPASIQAYAARCLRDSHDASPYLAAESALVFAVANAVAEAAGRSFLVALIVARTLAWQVHLPKSSDPEWRASLPKTAADAMHQDLQSRLGPDADKARDLLRPLAYAAGAGLPWEDIWAPLATALGQESYTDEDIIWLRSRAGYYIVEAQQTGRSVYRLYHAALAEYLRQDHNEEQVNATIVDFLAAHTRAICAALQPDWLRAHPYTRAHLATHAARACRLDPFLLDPGFLLTAEVAGVLAALPSAKTTDAQRAGAAYQRTLHRLSHGSAAQRLSYLELSSHRCGADALSSRFTTYPGERPWQILWTRWPTEHAHRVLVADGKPIIHLGCIPVQGRSPLLLTISDARWYIWDPVTGEQLREDETGRVPLADAVTITCVDGTIRLVTVDYAWQMRVYDIRRMELLRVVAIAGSWKRTRNRALASLGDAMLANANVPPLACARLPDGTPVAVTVENAEATIRFLRNSLLPVRVVIWDIERGKLRKRIDLARERYDAYSKLTGLACQSLSEGPTVAILRFGHATFYAIDLLSGTQLGAQLALDPGGTAYLTAPDGRRWALRLFDTEFENRYDPETAIDMPILLPEGDNIRIGTRRASDTQLVLTGHIRPVTRATWLPTPTDHSDIVSGSLDGTIRIWAGPFNHDHSPPPIINTYQFDIIQMPDGKVMGATADDSDPPNESHIRIWDFNSGTPVMTFPLPCSVSALACLWSTARIPTVIAYCTDYTVRAWDLFTGRPVFTQPADENSFAMHISGTLLPEGKSIFVTTGHNNSAAALGDARTGEFGQWLCGHTGWVSDAACGTYHGRAVAVTVGYDHRVCIWKLPEGELLHRFGVLRQHQLADLAFDRPESILLTELGDGQSIAIIRNKNGAIHIWNLDDWQHLNMLPNTAATLDVACSRISKSRVLLVTADADASLRVWLLTTRQTSTRNQSYTTSFLTALNSNQGFSAYASILIIQSY